MIQKSFNLAAILLLTLASVSYAQDNAKKHLPIIDVHVHAMKVNPAFAADMCPWFDQKRDILFNNAVRFFRLDETKYK